MCHLRVWLLQEQACYPPPSQYCEQGSRKRQTHTDCTWCYLGLIAKAKLPKLLFDCMQSLGSSVRRQKNQFRKTIGTFWNSTASSAGQAPAVGQAKVALAQACSQAWVISHCLQTRAVKCTSLVRQSFNTPNQMKYRSQNLPYPPGAEKK